MSKKSYSHSGDAGDVIYALPALASMGGGSVRLTCNEITGNRMTCDLAGSLATLLRRQTYIDEVTWGHYPDAVNLDEWRKKYVNNFNLADMVSSAFDQPHWPREKPWLDVDPVRIAPVVFHRSPRYQNWKFPWGDIHDLYRGIAVFVGYQEEHNEYCRNVGPISYWHTANYLSLAQVIAGCDLFVGNQSSPYAVAEGLKKPTIQEVSPTSPNCHFARDLATYIRGSRPTLHDPSSFGSMSAHSCSLKGSNSINDRDRLTELARLTLETNHLRGDAVEVGVYTGGSAAVMLSAITHGTLHLYDTFAGIPEDDAEPEGHRTGEFSCDIETVRKNLAIWSRRFTLHPGQISDTMSIADARYRIVHVDVNTYQSTLSAIRTFWPRLVQGGVLVLTGYGWQNCPGIKRAVSEFLPDVRLHQSNLTTWVISE
jgi:hypothetical protein